MNIPAILYLILVIVAIIFGIIGNCRTKDTIEMLKNDLKWTKKTAEDEHKDFILLADKLGKREQRIEGLMRDIDFHRNKANFEAAKSAEAEAKNATLTEIIGKLLDQQTNRTDSIFVYDGKCYRVKDLQLTRTVDSVETLDISCDRIYLEGDVI